MAYLGNDLQVAYPTYRTIDDISGSFNGSTTSFSLLVNGAAPVPLPLSSNQCLISVGGVIQRPDDSGTEGFRLSGGNIIFSSAPSTGEDFFGVVLAGADYVNAGGNFPDGSVSAPSITFDQDNDTGYYRSASGAVSFSSNGVASGTWNAAGISASALVPTGSTVPANGVYLPTTNTVAFSTNSSERLRVDSSGRLGLGTSSPGGNLDVRGISGTTIIRAVGGDSNGNADVEIFSTGSTGNSRLYFADTAAQSGSIIYSHNDNSLAFATNGAGTDVIIDSSGRLGIGTTSPGRLLSVQGIIGAYNSSGANDSHLLLTNDGSVSSIQSTYGSTGAFTPLSFWTSSSERGRFDTSGRFLVGTSTAESYYSVYTPSTLFTPGVQVKGAYPNANLALNTTNDGSVIHLANSSVSTSSGRLLGAISFNASDGTNLVTGAGIQAYTDATTGSGDMPGRLVFSTTADGASSPTERMRIDNAGKILAGATSTLHAETKYFFSNSSTGGGEGVVAIRNTASSTFDSAPGLNIIKTSATTTSSARFIQFYANDTGTPMGGIVGNGASNVQFASISDERDKENIQPFANAAQKLSQLDVVSFDWKNGSGHVNAGFIAQNVETVFPEYVVENISNGEDEPRKGITGGMSAGYIAVLTAALQEALQKIDAMEARLAALEAA